MFKKHIFYIYILYIINKRIDYNLIFYLVILFLMSENYKI